MWKPAFMLHVLAVFLISSFCFAAEDEFSISPTPLRSITASWRKERVLATGEILGKTVVLDVITAWTRSYGSFSAPLGGRVPILGDYVGLPVMEESLDVNFGDGTSSGSVLHGIVVAVDEVEDLIVVRTSLEHVYSAENRYIATITACCKPSVIANNPNRPWQVRVAVDLAVAGVTRSILLEGLPILSVYLRHADTGKRFSPFGVGKKEMERVKSVVGDVQFSPYEWVINETLRINRTDSIKQSDIIFDTNLPFGKEPYPYFFNFSSDGSFEIGSMAEFPPGLYDAYVEITTTVKDLFVGFAFCIFTRYEPVSDDIDARLSTAAITFQGSNWYEGYTRSLEVGCSVGKAGADITPFFRFADELVNVATGTTPGQAYTSTWTPCLGRLIDVVYCVRVTVKSTDPIIVLGDIISMPTCFNAEVLVDPAPVVQVAMSSTDSAEWGMRHDVEDGETYAVYAGIEQMFFFNVADQPEEICEVTVSAPAMPDASYSTFSVRSSATGCSGNFSFTPALSEGGSSFEVCVTVKDSASACRKPEMDRVCYTVAVQKCQLRAVGGETLMSLASTAGSSFQMMWMLNNDRTNPFSTYGRGETVKMGKMYSAVEGDTLYSLSADFGTTEELIKKKNWDISGSALKAGSQYCITPTTCEQQWQQ
eukprot:CAMPEP_0113883300 /NCGR_PEP_ID=MMETSP0780_2-20120614/9505_1 /TAXON_ID=652834 /ORGANISM="Palpitomonas bilix" /LENGTH=650 /DNA_ID=CAMNT_0000870553 /DNA_START=228 /DNA_END=2180 /DNA_ORIENTATION=- /assembly_acc=CAM_ASM_000599